MIFLGSQNQPGIGKCIPKHKDQAQDLNCLLSCGVFLLPVVSQAYQSGHCSHNEIGDQQHRSPVRQQKYRKIIDKCQQDQFIEQLFRLVSAQIGITSRQGYCHQQKLPGKLH